MLKAPIFLNHHLLALRRLFEVSKNADLAKVYIMRSMKQLVVTQSNQQVCFEAKMAGPSSGIFSMPTILRVKKRGKSLLQIILDTRYMLSLISRSLSDNILGWLAMRHFLFAQRRWWFFAVPFVILLNCMECASPGIIPPRWSMSFEECNTSHAQE